MGTAVLGAEGIHQDIAPRVHQVIEARRRVVGVFSALILVVDAVLDLDPQVFGFLYREKIFPIHQVDCGPYRVFSLLGPDHIKALVELRVYPVVLFGQFVDAEAHQQLIDRFFIGIIRDDLITRADAQAQVHFRQRELVLWQIVDLPAPACIFVNLHAHRPRRPRRTKVLTEYFRVWECEVLFQGDRPDFLVDLSFPAGACPSLDRCFVVVGVVGGAVGIVIGLVLRPNLFGKVWIVLVCGENDMHARDFLRYELKISILDELGGKKPLHDPMLNVWGVQHQDDDRILFPDAVAERIVLFRVPKILYLFQQRDIDPLQALHISPLVLLAGPETLGKDQHLFCQPVLDARFQPPKSPVQDARLVGRVVPRKDLREDRVFDLGFFIPQDGDALFLPDSLVGDECAGRPCFGRSPAPDQDYRARRRRGVV